MLAFLLALCLTTVARAASFDPDLTWRTLTTPHFKITFHGGEEALAEEVSHLLEDIWVEMTAEIQHEPRRRVEVVLIDNTDSANGYAMTLPVNTIVIYVTAPQERSTLSRYENWNDAILTHELVHILHLDTTEGLVRILRSTLGRIISTNNVSPGWIIEGQATYQETKHTNGGRGRAPMADMIKRMAVLEDAFPPLGNMDGWQTDPPGGNLRYLFGQDFAQFIADRTGEDVWTDWIHVYGGWVVPYWLPAKKVFGKRYVPLYFDWKAHLEERYALQKAAVEAQGITERTQLSDDAESCAAPSFSPNGRKLVWSCSNPYSGSAIYVMELEEGQSAAEGEAEVEVENFFASHVAWRADSKAFAYSTSHVVGRFNLYQDIYLYSVGGETTKALTSGKRARDPVFSPDGRELLVVRNKAQNNQLARMTIDQRLVDLTDHQDHTQLSTPRFSPDGKTLAMSMWRDGRRDLWLFTPEGEPIRRLTSDTALDIHPHWSPDGKTLYFSSDRSGIFNVYAIDLTTETLYQVTNVLGGAFNPSVDPTEREMVFEDFSHNGMDIALMALDREQWWDLGKLQSPLEYTQPLAEVVPSPEALEALRKRLDDEGAFEEPETDDDEDTDDKDRKDRKKRRRQARIPTDFVDEVRFPGLDGLGGTFAMPSMFPRASRPGAPDQPDTEPLSDDPTLVDPDEAEEKSFDFTYPVGRYNPLPTLLPPRYILPAIYQTSYGFMGTLATGGTDTLRRYFYSAYASYRTDSDYVGWGGSFTYNRHLPVYTVGAYSYTVPYGDVFVVGDPPDGGGAYLPGYESNNERYWDRRIRGYAQVSYSFKNYQSVFGRIEGTFRDSLDPLPANAYTPLLPTRGYLSTVGGGWRWSKGRSYTKSISPEDARLISVVGEVTTPLLGSYVLDEDGNQVGFTQLQVTSEWREYTTLPWAKNHVLANKLAAGASFGDSLAYGSYRLGGSFGESGYYTLPDEWRAVRGFDPATVDGDWFYLGSLEYRLPIAWVDRGVGTIPFFARYLAAAFYVDFGNAFYDIPEGGGASLLSGTLVGTGAELKGSAIIGWGIPVTVRAGYGFGINGTGAIPFGSLDGFYVWLGSSF